MEEEPPNKKIVLFASLIVLLIIGYCLPFSSKNSLETKLKRENAILEDGLGLIQENTLLPIIPPVYFDISALGYRVITAYSSSLDETDDTPFITASGQEVRDGIIACPREYKFGTLVKIGEETYICEDRLSLKYDDRFDIWFSSKREAKEWGKQILLVEIYE